MQRAWWLGLAICAVPTEAAVAGCAEGITGLPALRGPSLVELADERRPERRGWPHAPLERSARRAGLAARPGLCPHARPRRCPQQPLGSPRRSAHRLSLVQPHGTKAPAHTQETAPVPYPAPGAAAPLVLAGPGSKTAAAPNHAALGVVSGRAGASWAVEGNLRDGQGLQLPSSS